jgi:hypothetical protein
VLDPDPAFADDEECTVNVIASQVADQDGTPDNMASNYSWSFKVNTQPTLLSNTNREIVLGKGETVLVTSNHICLTDAESAPEDLTYRVVEGPFQGELNMTTFTQADIDAGRVTYTHTGNTHDSFEVMVSDGVSTYGPYTITVYLTHRCVTLVQFSSVDPAPINGELRFYTRFGYDSVRPEGAYEYSIPVVAGRPTTGAVKVECNSQVRAWLFQDNYAVGLVPHQWENGDGVLVPGDEDLDVAGEFDVTEYIGFYRHLVQPDTAGYDVTQPDLSNGAITYTDLGNGLREWGLWYRYLDNPATYITLGWIKQNDDGTVDYAVPDNGPLTLEEFLQVAEYHTGD